MKSLYGSIKEGIFDAEADFDLPIYQDWLKTNTGPNSTKLVKKIILNSDGEMEWPSDDLELYIREPLPPGLKFADNKQLFITCYITLSTDEVILDFLPKNFKGIKLYVMTNNYPKLIFNKKHTLSQFIVSYNSVSAEKSLCFNFRNVTCKHFNISIPQRHKIIVDETKWPIIQKRCKLSKSVIIAYWNEGKSLKINAPEIKGL